MGIDTSERDHEYDREHESTSANAITRTDGNTITSTRVSVGMRMNTKVNTSMRADTRTSEIMT